MNDFDRLYREYLHLCPFEPGWPRREGVEYSDTVLHLPTLEFFASQCWHVSEFGTRGAHSTCAFLRGCKGEVHSYDIERTGMIAWLHQRREQLPTRWFFHQADTSDRFLAMGETDLLYLDTLHTYEHLDKELRYHGRKARKYLIFHDTASCGAVDISGPNPNARGIGAAIREFRERFRGEYRVAFETVHNNGLLVLERINRY